MHKDKLLHFGVCFIASLVLGIATNMGIAIAFPAGLAIGKEVGDYFNPNSSGYVGDLLADMIGIAAGVLIALVLGGTK